MKLLKDFTSDSAQSCFANSNNEYRVVPTVAASSVVEGPGEFTAATLNLNELGKRQARAQEIYNEVGYK
ncbi:hypothetical protein [Hoeflea alexandrii]|uniref:hypothetical protein n=1 Tax=Hoeflea alexandrii TaxID=288436 RepID=UPI0022AFBB2E|nr:hypothetical protein [Hoeflea alexandrii]MCZ4290066.1 hypothetical protein [Hoeflea alexandrii]